VRLRVRLMDNPILKPKKTRIVREGERKTETSAKPKEATTKDEKREFEKAKMLKDLIIDALEGRRVLILVENMYGEEEMNKILQPVVTIMGIALATSQQDDPSHFIAKYGGGVSTVTNVLEYRSESADEFARIISEIKKGKYEDDRGNIFVLYRLNADGERDLNSNYVIFAVGSEVDSAIKTIENTLGPAAVKFSSPVDNAGATWVVLMIPLSLNDLKNGPIEIPSNLIEEIHKKIDQINSQSPQR